MMTYANAFIALRRMRAGEPLPSSVLVALRRRGLIAGPLCIKLPSVGPRGHRKVANVWHRVWRITAAGHEFLGFVEDALARQADERNAFYARVRARLHSEMWNGERGIA